MGIQEYFKKRPVIWVLFGVALILTPALVNHFAWVQRHPIDIAPLAQLTPEQVAQFEARLPIMSLDPNFYLRRVDSDPAQAMWRRSYEFSYGAIPQDSVSVMIRFYHDVDQRVRYMERDALRSGHHLITNDNGTQVLIHRVRASRSMGIPTEYRFLRTRIRIGDASILIWDHRDRLNLRDNTGSDFIQFLYEQLAS